MAVEGEAGWVLAVHVFHPSREHDGQPGTVGDGRVQRRQLVFQPMSGPVLVAAHSGESLMAEHAGPHDVRTSVVVFRVGQHARRLGADGVHERQIQVVGHGHGAHVVEEALQ